MGTDPPAPLRCPTSSESASRALVTASAAPRPPSATSSLATTVTDCPSRALGPPSVLRTGSPNIIEGNFIGTDVTGTKALGNGIGVSQNSVGLNMRGANILGGSAPGAGNLISGNLAQAVMITSGEGSIIQGNFIGTDVTGTKKINNQGQGIVVNDNDFQPTAGVTIGGTQPGAGNLISGNMAGIVVIGSLNVIQGNKIGTDITGKLKLGNLNWGITVEGDTNTVGGPATGAGNLISGNGTFGILFIPFNTATSGTVIQGNLIGTQADGISPLGNGSDGIAVAASFSVSPGGTGPFNDLIGGTDPGDANIIAFNGHDGINVAAGLEIGILSNSIYSNASFGIDLGANGHTANDTNDTDTGANNLQNYPVLTTIVTDGTHTSVTGTLNSTPGTVFMLQFFASPTADPSGFGQGQTLLGTRQVITDGSGNAAFTVSFSTAVPVGQFISATATDLLNNTSEFSATIQITGGTVTPNQPPAAGVGGPYTINEGGFLSLDASRSSDPDGDLLTYSWDINGDGVFGDATGVKPTLSWAQLNALGIVNGPSSFTVSVRVDDGQRHLVTSSSTDLSVLNVAPVADAGPGEIEVTEGGLVTLTGEFTDPGTADTHTFNWHVDADNGQTIADSSDQDFSFIPDDNGTYTVTFTVTDNDSGIGSAVVEVDVDNADPVATMIGLPAEGTVGVQINLTSSVTDASPIDTAAGFQYEWDATLEHHRHIDFSGDSADFSFTPPQSGTYHVDLVVFDKDGGESFVSYTLVVADNTGNHTPPDVTVTDAGGTYNGSPYPGTALVNGAANLEGVSPTLAYYSGSTATGTPLGGAPSVVGTYTEVASFAGSADYASANSSPVTFSITQATPTVTVSDSGGKFTGSTFPATATVAGVDNTPAASLEGVSPTLTYYAGSTATGTPLSGRPVRWAPTPSSRASPAARIIRAPPAVRSLSTLLRRRPVSRSPIMVVYSPAHLTRLRPSSTALRVWKALARR